MSLSVPASSVVRSAGSGLARRFSPIPVLGRIAGWIRGWHGGQLVTFWAGVVVIPWQIGVWRALLISNRLEGFLNPGVRPGRAGRVAEILIYFVLPLAALVVTAVWVSGRVRRTRFPRG